MRSSLFPPSLLMPRRPTTRPSPPSPTHSPSPRVPHPAERGISLTTQSLSSTTASPSLKIRWCPRADLNHHQRLRTPLFYPIELQGHYVLKSCKELSVVKR